MYLPEKLIIVFHYLLVIRLKSACTFKIKRNRLIDDQVDEEEELEFFHFSFSKLNDEVGLR